MIELKAFRIIQGDTGGYGAPSYKCDTDGNRIEEWSDICEVYPKSETDHYISELIADQQLELDDWYCKVQHNKYKRCLAMAKWCRESLRLMRTYEVTEDFWNLEPGQDAEYFCKKGDFYSKWRKRWLQLAEKFKEAK